jgi:hypothetical protein
LPLVLLPLIDWPNARAQRELQPHKNRSKRLAVQFVSLEHVVRAKTGIEPAFFARVFCIFAFSSKLKSKKPSRFRPAAAYLHKSARFGQDMNHDAAAVLSSWFRNTEIEPFLIVFACRLPT